ncbi:MAG: PEP-CTERM sorting domain-containing protein, partial [Myxococcota bacterium]|nr:PEP-CTERM sorting domain-containing protein [Myxococcota bacterium]
TSTAAVGGVVQLIAASQITSDLTQGSSAKVASAQTMLIEFVPEPGMLLMLGSGIAGLVLIGRKRMRK